MLVDVNDLSTSLNPGATYFAEANYIVPTKASGARLIPPNATCITTLRIVRYNVIGVNQPFSFTSVGSPCASNRPLKLGLARR